MNDTIERLKRTLLDPDCTVTFSSGHVFGAREAGEFPLHLEAQLDLLRREKIAVFALTIRRQLSGRYPYKELAGMVFLDDEPTLLSAEEFAQFRGDYANEPDAQFVDANDILNP